MGKEVPSGPGPPAHVLPGHLALPRVPLGRAGWRSQPGLQFSSDSVKVQTAPTLRVVTPHRGNEQLLSQSSRANFKMQPSGVLLSLQMLGIR